MDEVMSRPLRFIRLQEDKEMKKRSKTPSPYDNLNKKARSLARRSYKSKPYSKPNHQTINALDDKGEDDEFPEEY